jgi:prepilin-type processing-associated H-X9-DG protein
MTRAGIHRPALRAFTIAELLVVIAIITLLLALAIPAIQRVRGAYDVIRCAAQLRQLGLAAHHHDSDYGRLPPGYFGPDPALGESFPSQLYTGQWIGHLPMLLPYLEEAKLARDIKLDLDPRMVTPFPWFWASAAQDINPGLYAVADNKLKFLICPTAASYAPEVGNAKPGGGGTLIGLHVFNSPTVGVMTVGWRDDYIKSAQYVYLGRTTYVGSAGCGSGSHPLYGVFEGIYTNRSTLSLAQVAAADGASNTLLYGEACGSHWNGCPPRTLDMSWMGCGALGTYGGLRRAIDSEIIHFSSFHSAGVQFCFADGSVRMVRRGQTAASKSADWYVLQELAGWHDGGKSDASSLID